MWQIEMVIGHLERNNVEDWVSACSSEDVAGVKCRGRELEKCYYCPNHRDILKKNRYRQKTS